MLLPGETGRSGVQTVVIHLCSRHDFIFLGQDVHQLALAFIAPLGPQNNADLGVELVFPWGLRYCCLAGDGKVLRPGTERAPRDGLLPEGNWSTGACMGCEATAAGWGNKPSIKRRCFDVQR